MRMSACGVLRSNWGQQIFFCSSGSACISFETTNVHCFYTLQSIIVVGAVAHRFRITILDLSMQHTAFHSPNMLGLWTSWRFLWLVTCFVCSLRRILLLRLSSPPPSRLNRIVAVCRWSYSKGSVGDQSKARMLEHCVYTSHRPQTGLLSLAFTYLHTYWLEVRTVRNVVRVHGWRICVGNPFIVECLFITERDQPPSGCYKTPAWRWLERHRKRFFTQDTVHEYLHKHSFGHSQTEQVALEENLSYPSVGCVQLFSYGALSRYVKDIVRMDNVELHTGQYKFIDLM
jgi:hypothetical protein